MNVQQFEPKEIKVKVVGSIVIVKAKCDHNSAHFMKNALIPGNVNPYQITATLFNDKLIVQAPVNEHRSSNKRGTRKNRYIKIDVSDHMYHIIN